MASTDEEQAPPPARSHEQRARQRALEALSRFEAAALQGEPPARMKLELAQAALMLHNALWHHRAEPVARPLWKQLDMSGIRDRLGRTTEAESPAPGRTNATRTVEQPAIYDAPWHEIVEPIRQLDDIFKALGLGEQVAAEDRPEGVIEAPGVDYGEE